MSEAYVDPQKLTAFAEELHSTNSLITSRIAELAGRVAKLGASWRDPQFDEFRSRMVRTQQHLELFSNEVRRAVAQLRIDAEAAREVQRVNMPNR